MFRKTILTAMLVALAGTAAQAQDPRVEISATAGWMFSDGVSGNAVVVPGVGTFDRIDPKDAFSWGLRLGFLVNENSEIGFLFNQQATELEIGGTKTAKLGDLSIYNYHGYYAYNFGDTDAKARPYILFGLGATQYGTISRERGRRAEGHRGEHQVLRDGRPRAQALPEPEVRHPPRGPLDPDLHQVGRRRLVV